MSLAEEIFSFQDPRSFLKAVLDDKKKQGSKLSLRVLASRAGLSSPSTLSMIISGKRTFTPRVAEKVARALKLTGRRKEYLVAMATKDSARTEEEKLFASEALVKLRTHRSEHLLELQQFRFLSRWYYPAIYVLIDTKDFRNEPDWIAKRLSNKVTVEQVRLALKDLVQLGLIRDEAGRLSQTRGKLSAGDSIKHAAVYRYHKEMIGLASNALTLPSNLRELNGLTVTVPLSKLPEVKEKIREFRSEMNSFISDDLVQKNRQKQGVATTEEVFQMNIHFFPLTKPTLRFDDSTLEVSAKASKEDEERE